MPVWLHQHNIFSHLLAGPLRRIWERLLVQVHQKGVPTCDSSCHFKQVQGRGRQVDWSVSFAMAATAVIERPELPDGGLTKLIGQRHQLDVLRKSLHHGYLRVLLRAAPVCDREHELSRLEAEILLSHYFLFLFLHDQHPLHSFLDLRCVALLI